MSEGSHVLGTEVVLTNANTIVLIKIRKTSPFFILKVSMFTALENTEYHTQQKK